MKLSQPQRPDVYIGIVAAAGTDLSVLKAQLRAQFAAMGYLYHQIKVSDLLAKAANASLTALTEDVRIKYLMDVGDSLRKAAKSGDAGLFSSIN